MGQLITFYNTLIFKEKLELLHVLVKTILEPFDIKFIVTEGGQANA